MKNITKTADLSEYTDEQIKIMFQSMELFEVVKTLVEVMKTGDIGTSYRFDRQTFDNISPSKQILHVLKITCEKNKIDPKLLNL